MKKYTLLILTLCMHCIARGQTAHYWFDNQPGEERLLTSVVMGQFDIDVSGLKEGVHTLHYQATDTEGNLSPTMSATFIKPYRMVADASCAETFRCWFDEDIQNAVTGRFADGAFFLNTEGLKNGVHTVHLYAEGEYPSPTVSCSYVKFDTPEDRHIESLRCVCYIDGVAVEEQILPTTGGTVNWNVDVAQLSLGVHTQRIAVYDQNNIALTGRSSIFVHVPQKEKHLTKYDYWLNDEDVIKTVELEGQPTNYNLLTMLPVESRPIRSECFHFAVKDDVPKVYAKNDIHLRFHDARGDMTNVSGQYVDEHISQPVEATLLESGISQTIDKPAANEIKWFKLEAVRGDSLSFKLNRAATLQVFSPSGQEVFSASGSDVVYWCGCHTRETGTYYLALHDVTAQYGNTVGIEYEHIDKYAVLRQDVSVVGNGGCSTITFEGNGFRDLYAVSLISEQGDSIHHVYIGHESDATTSVVFDFTDVDLGQYNAVFRFAEEDKVFTNLVTVEEARDIELATTVTYPSTFLIGTSTTYTIKIENKGNMTAYAVPVEMHLFADDIASITEIQFDGYVNNMSFPFELLEDSIDIEDLDILKECIKNAKGLSQFVVYHDSVNGNDYALSHAILTLPPNSTRQFTVSIKSNAVITFEAYSSKNWFPVSIHGNVAMSRMKDDSMRQSMCCMREKVECVADIVVNIASVALPPGANCITSLSKNGLETLYDVWCSEGSDMAERFDNYLKAEGQNLANRLLESAITCVTGFYGKWLKELRNDRVMAAKIGNVAEVERLTSQIRNVRDALNGALKALYDGLSTMILGKGCVNAFTEQKPNCPPDPGGGGGPSSPVASMDPNDIHGYTAESGSHAVKDGLTDVYYRIEFENDTTFATASAHDIYVTDTLDATKFNLSTYKPTRIKIGEKSAELTGDKNFVTTVDMRPEINAIAQVEGTYDQQKGIAKWHISSLDPMTMEPTKYVQDGVLPVNTNGRGIGELSFDIALKPNLTHGTEVKNRAGIVFDTNDVIMTPTWTNTIDRVLPESHVTDVAVKTDSTAVVSIGGSDEGSGPWRYDVYVQYGEGAAWWKAAENVPADTTATVKIYSGIKTAFCSVLTDQAGNVEAKEMHSEMSIFIGGMAGDVNGDRQVGIGDIVAVTNYMAGNAGGITKSKADVNGDGDVGIGDIVAITNIMAGTAKARNGRVAVE